MSTSGFKYLRPEDIQKLSSFEFAPKMVVEGYFSGRHRSLTQGISTEFRDYRPYSQGDDPRLVDWRVYARTDRHYLKTYNQETSMNCYIFLDSSASMGFSDGKGPTKLEYASFFAAALSFLVVRSNNLVSLLTFDEKMRFFLPPGSTTSHLHTILHQLEDNPPGGKTSLSEALRRAHPLLQRKGTLIVLSDFFDDSAAIFSALSPYLHRGFRVHLFQVLTPPEMDFNYQGFHAFQDMETHQKVRLHADALRDRYQQAMGEHIQNLRVLSIRRQIHYLPIRTDTHFFRLFDELVA
jgi:uncharacterized protein (DUF58 family)